MDLSVLLKTLSNHTVRAAHPPGASLRPIPPRRPQALDTSSPSTPTSPEGSSGA